MVSRRVLQRVLDKVLLGLVLKVEVIGFAVFFCCRFRVWTSLKPLTLVDSVLIALLLQRQAFPGLEAQGFGVYDLMQEPA